MFQTPARDAERARAYPGRMRSSSLLVATSLLAASCDSGSSYSQYFVAPASLTIEVDYETSAAPYEGLGDGTLFATNVDAVFPSLGAAYTAPATVAAMEELGAIADDSLTVDELLALADEHRALGRTEGAERRLYIVFLDGYFEDATGTRDDVLGVSIGTTGVIAMFKPVIDSAGFLMTVRRRVEQTVLVHEFGHSVGLVDNGAPNVSAHVDEEHGAHCTNEDCVMYWANHAGAGVFDFAMLGMNSGAQVLFDQACLDDLRAHYGP